MSIPINAITYSVVYGGLRMLNTKQAAEHLNVTSYTVRTYIKKGILNAVRIGKAYLIPEQELARLLKKQKTEKQILHPMD